jgi:zinc transport system substrate-binding protein
MRTRIVLTLTVAAALTGCGGDDSESGAQQGTGVVAAFYPLAYAAEEIGGPGVDVVNLTPPGAEPHDLELSIRDVEQVRDADLVLYLSGFQPALERAVRDANGRTVDLLEGLDLLAGGAGHEEEAEEEGHAGEEESEFDPHVWLDPVRYTQVADRIAAALEAAPGAEAFATELRELDADYERGLADCERHELVTSHAAFGYLADRYGLEQIAISGLTPEAEPTASELEHVVDQIREHGATTVFFETLVSPKLAETVARESGATTAALDPLEGLTEEALARGENYFSVMRRNLESLRRALGCR